MNAFAIKRIPNAEHTQRVLETRRALRLVPPSEGVWPCDSDGSPEGRDAQRLDGEAATARAGTASPNPLTNQDSLL